MTIVAFPLDAVSGAPSYTAQMARQALAAFAGPAAVGRPLGAFSGVRQGTPTSTTVTATSSTWTVNPHAGYLDLETPLAAAPYAYAVTVAETGGMTPASSSNTRIDLITIRINDPAVDSSSVPGATIQTYVGTPSATPVAPSTPAGELALAQITVPKLGTGSPSVAWVAPTAGKVYWQAKQTTTGTNVANDAYTTVVFNVLEFAYFGAPAIGGGSFRAPVDGLYLVGANLSFPANATGSRGGVIAVNGTQVDGTFVLSPAGSGVNRLAVPQRLVRLSTGDVVSLQAYQNSGGVLATGVSPGCGLTALLV